MAVQNNRNLIDPAMYDPRARMEGNNCTLIEVLLVPHLVVLNMDIKTTERKIACIVLSTGLGAAEGALIGSIAAGAGAAPGAGIGAAAGFLAASVKVAREIHRSRQEQQLLAAHQQ